MEFVTHDFSVAKIYFMFVNGPYHRGRKFITKMVHLHKKNITKMVPVTTRLLTYKNFDTFMFVNVANIHFNR